MAVLIVKMLESQNKETFSSLKEAADEVQELSDSLKVILNASNKLTAH